MAHRCWGFCSEDFIKTKIAAVQSMLCSVQPQFFQKRKAGRFRGGCRPFREIENENENVLYIIHRFLGEGF